MPGRGGTVSSSPEVVESDVSPEVNADSDALPPVAGVVVIVTPIAGVVLVTPIAGVPDEPPVVGAADVNEDDAEGCNDS